MKEIMTDIGTAECLGDAGGAYQSGTFTPTGKNTC
jgi:hypothetical protein